MSYQDPLQRQTSYNGLDIKIDQGDSQSPEEDGAKDGKKASKHRRNYQACEPCRERKVKCDLGDVDNPRNGPCKKCARESKQCWFRETRKKDATKDSVRPAKRPRTDSSTSARTFQAPGQTFSPTTPTFAYQQHPLSPMRPFPQTTSPALTTVQGLNGFPQPRSTPSQYSQLNAGIATAQDSIDYRRPRDHAASGDDHVIVSQTNALAESFTNTTDSVTMLIQAANLPDVSTDTSELGNHRRGRDGGVGMPHVSPEVAKSRKQAREVWSQMRYVRAGWFTADEALEYVEYFYSHLAPMTPVVTQYFRDPATHRKLLTEEPVLALAILAITSRYYKLKTDGGTSRGYYIHEDLWNSLRKIVQRLLWCQEQFGGGFTGAGMVSTQQSSSGQLTWKGSLRTLGTIEALLLLTDWQPRALHFPPGDDENMLVGANFALLDDEIPRASESAGLPYANWLEPAWRSDRMSWMLLGLAQSLAFELGVFDLSHEHCKKDHGPKSECTRKRRLRRLVITYVCQISGRMGIQAQLSPSQDIDPEGPELNEHYDRVDKLWFDIASLMFEANRDLFASRDSTARLIESGRYKAAVEEFHPKLARWMSDYKRIERSIQPAMRAVLKMEYEYSRLYINSLGLQKVVGEMALRDRNSVSRGLSTQLASVHDENKVYISEVRDAADQILKTSCYELGDLRALGYSPVRTYLRTLSGLMFSLKLFSLGNQEPVVRATFRLLREMTRRMRDQVVDDVHLAPRTAQLISKLMHDVHGSMVRMPKPGSQNQSRHMSPQLQQGHNGNGTYSVSDQESPDTLAQLPIADYGKHVFMPPPGFEGNLNFDASLGFDGGIDPSLFSGSEDWVTLPIDGLLDFDVSTVNQGYGGIGPTFGDRDMLSLITGTTLDQNQGLGSGMPNFPGMGMGMNNGYS